MSWYYKSPIGTIRIVRSLDGTFAIIIDGVDYGGYDSPNDAADAVHGFCTGSSEWDLLNVDVELILDVPKSLDEWKRL